MNIRVLASSSAGNAVLLDDPDAGLLLVDAGLRFRELQKATGFRLSQLEGCLISHEHGDHSLAAAKVAECGVDIYATAGTLATLDLPRHRTKVVEPLGETYDVGGFRVRAFPTIHDAAEPCGFLIASPSAKVLYLTDSAWCEYRFFGLTHILVEANCSVEIMQRRVEAGELPADQYHRVIRNHMSLERTLDLLRANDLSRVEEIHLLHLSDGNSDEAAFAQAVREATGLPVQVAPR